MPQPSESAGVTTLFSTFSLKQGLATSLASLELTCIDQAGRNFTGPPAFVYGVLGLKAWAPRMGYKVVFDI